MPNKYQQLLAVLSPYVIAYDVNQGLNERELPGLKINSSSFYNPLALSSRSFIEKIYLLDQLTFSGQGMGMPRWVFLDCSVMPGFVFGFKVKGEYLTLKDRELLKVNANDEVPLSMYIAIPTQRRKCWFGHNLSSLNGILETKLDGLGFLTKYMALALYDISKQQGATQWTSEALALHLKFGPLKLLSSYTPTHSLPATLCYEASFKLNTDKLTVESEQYTANASLSLQEQDYLKYQNMLEQGHCIYLTGLDLKNKQANVHIVGEENL